MDESEKVWQVRTVLKDFSGMRFGLLTAISPKRINGRTNWLCKCDCGTEKYVLRQCLIAGQKSCGCISQEARKKGASEAAKRKLHSRFEKKLLPITETGCLIWMGQTNNTGYGCTTLNGKPIKAHRLAWILSNGEIENNKHVLHICDIPSCCNPKHLFLGTHQDNMKDRQIKQRQPHGINHARAKLSESDVLYIRNSSERNIDLAVKFDVPGSCICNIKKRKIWRHLP